LARLSAKKLEIKFNENELSAIDLQKDTNKKLRLTRQDLIPQLSASQAACLSIELQGIRGSEGNRH